MKKDSKKIIKSAVKMFGKAVSLLSVIFIIRAVIVLGFDFSIVDNWYLFLLLAAGCSLAKCVTVFMSATAWYRWLAFFSGKKGLYIEALHVYSKANIGKYLPGNVMHYVERNLFAGKMEISQKKIAMSTVMEVTTLVTAACIISVCSSLEQLDRALAGTIGSNYVEVLITIAVVLLCIAGLFCIVFYGKIKKILSSYKLSDFAKTYIVNILLNGGVLLILGILMVALYAYVGGDVSLKTGALIVSGYVIAWVLGFIVPGAPGGIGVRELVITLLLSPIIGEGLVVTLSITHRLITIIGDFMAYLFGMTVLGNVEKRSAVNE